MLEQKIAQLEERLRSAQVVDTSDLSTDVVQIGVTVNIKDEKTGDSDKYTIVGSAEAEPVGEEALQRVAGRQGAARATSAATRSTCRCPAARSASSRSPRSTSRKAAMADEEGSELLAARRAKLERLRADGIDPFPHAYPGRHADQRGPRRARRPARRRGLRGALPRRRAPARPPRPGQDGLPRPRRPLGAHPAAGPGRRARRGAMARLLELDLGDIVGVDGLAFRSRRGELSLRVEGFELLAKSLRPPPDKFHGLQDVETRFRHRELDLIANEESRAVFIARARVVSAIRAYLDGAGFIEVETPILQPLYGGAMARPVHHAPQRARPRLLPAHRHRAVPQAPDRRRPREGLRAGQGLPQRGHLLQAQPRVHDARVVRGLRGLRGRHAPRRGAAAARGRRPPATRARSTSRRPTGA